MGNLVTVQYPLMSKIFIFFIVNFMIISSCFAQNDEDYLILNEFLASTKIVSKIDTIYLRPSNQNSFSIGVVESERYKEEYPGAPENMELDYGFISIQRDSVVDQILNEQEYDYLLTQKANSEWDFSKINVPNVFQYASNRKKRGNEIISVGKPVYTRDKKAALVSISYYTRSGIMVFRKINGQWLGNKIIAPLLVQPKVQVYQE